MGKRRAATSYIPIRHRLIRPQLEYLEAILDRHKVSRVNRLYFIHVYCSNKLQAYDSPIPGQTIWKYYRGAKPEELQRLGLIDLTEYWIGHCRRHRVSEPIMYESLALVNSMSSEEFMAQDYICYETGRVINRVPEPRCTDDNGKPEPAIIRRAIDRLARNETLVNLPALDNYTKNLAYDDADPKLKGLFYNDTSCLEGIRAHRPKRHNEVISRFAGAWHALRTGRLHIPGGCLQSASAAMKRVGYSGIPGFANFDAKSCQVYILIKEMERANIDAQPLLDYITTEDYKTVYGQRAGLPGKLLKRIVIALCMGAHMPKSARGYADRENTVLDCLAKVATTEEEMKALLGKLWETVGDIARAIHKWHYYLLEHYINANKVRGRGGYYLPNAVGKFVTVQTVGLFTASKFKQH